MTAEDVVAENTAGIGVPDPAQVGWDQHFGYGRPDLGPRAGADRRQGEPIPPQALITSPDWFAPLNARRSRRTVDDRAAGCRRTRSAATPTGSSGRRGSSPPRPSSSTPRSQRRPPAPLDGALGTHRPGAVRAALDARAGGGADQRPDRAQQGPGRQGPERARVHRARDRHRRAGQPRRGPQGAVRLPRRARCTRAARRTAAAAARRPSGCSTSTATTSSTSCRPTRAASCTCWSTTARRSRASTAASRCGRRPTRTCTRARRRYASVEPPREVLRTPAIGDIDGDLEPEIVDSAGEHVYAWNADGSAVPGFPVRLDPALSLPAGPHAREPRQARLHRLADARRPRRRRPPRDRRRRRSTSTSTPGTAAATPLPGFPRKLQRSRASPGAEIINTPAVGDITGDGRPEIVTPTARVRRQPAAPGDARRRCASAASAAASRTSSPTRSAAAAAPTRSTRNGAVLPGWPTKPNGAVPDALPLVGPGVDHVLGNVDADPELEVIGNVATGDVDGAPTATASTRSQLRLRARRPASTSTSPGSSTCSRTRSSRTSTALAGPEVIKGGADAQPAREPRRRGRPEPSLQPRRAGLERRRRARRCRASRRRSRTTSCSRARRWPTSPTRRARRSSSARASTTCATSTRPGVEGAGWPKFTGGWIFATPGDGRRRRRRQARGRRARRARATRSCGTPTGRPAAATTSGGPRRHDEWSTGAYGTDTRPPGTPTGLSGNAVDGGVGRADVDRARRRLAVRPGAPRTGSCESEQPDRPPGRRHGDRRLRRHRRPPAQTESPHRQRARARSSPSSTRTTPATGATCARFRSRRRTATRGPSRRRRSTRRWCPPTSRARRRTACTRSRSTTGPATRRRTVARS